MARLSFTQIQQLWIKNGGTPGWAPLAAGIAMAESGGTTQAYNTNPSTMDRSVGLWQINYFGQLYTQRSHLYGTPTKLRATPNAQARAAIGLSGNGHNWTPWRTDHAWNAWQAAGAPPQPSATAVQTWLKSVGAGTQLTGAAFPAGVNPTTAATINAAQATASTRGLPIPVQGEQYAYRGEKTFSIVTPSIIPGISATPPTGPHFGNNPIGDLATALRFAGSFGGWALMTAIVFVIGAAFLALGTIMLLGILFGPVIKPVADVVGPGKFRALNPGNRARRIEQRTRLATARARRATRDEADRQERAAGGGAGIRRASQENRRIARSASRPFSERDVDPGLARRSAARQHQRRKVSA